MTKSLKIMPLFLAALLLGTAGCKQVQTTFVNNTAEPLELQVNGPGMNTGYLGTIPPYGQVRTLIKVSPIWLPTTYTYTAGNKSGAFTLASDSNYKIWVNIPEGSVSNDPDWRMAEGETMTGSPTPVVYE